MGGKTSKSTQTVSIPPEVLARYNAVNSRAEQAAATPFQPYSYNPADFVAQLTPTQLAGIQNINYAAGQAQPYYDEATGQLMGAQMAATPYYAQAERDITGGQGYGMQSAQAAQNLLYGGLGASQPLNYQALGSYQQGYGQGQQLLGGGIGQFYGAQAAADPYQRAAAYNIGAAQDIGAQFAQQAYARGERAGQAADPFNYAASGAYQQGYGQGQELLGRGIDQFYGALAAAQPLQYEAAGGIRDALGVGRQLGAESYGTTQRAGESTMPINYQSLQDLQQALMAAQPYTQGAVERYQAGLGAAEPLQQYALQTLGRAGMTGETVSGEALTNLARAGASAQPLQQLAQGIYGEAYQGAQPYNQAALQQYYAGLGAAGPLTQAATQNIIAAQQGVSPYQQLATEFGLHGARAVSPGQLGPAQIAQYMSPYMQSVVQPTAALLNQQAQQAQAGQLGNAIRAGAFGGDRAGIAAANLQQQQQLAQGKVLGDLLQSGYGQALATAQQQQQLGLGAEQANRAAQQAAAGQLLGVGQAGFGQGMTAAQQQAALAQQLFGQQAAAGQNIAGLGQQTFQQGLASGQAQQALAQQLFGQGATTAQQQAAIAQQLFGQGATSAAQQAALAQQMFGQNATTAQGLAALGQQVYGQGTGTAQAQAAIGQQMFAQQMDQARQQAALSQMLYGQGLGASQAQAALAQQQFAQERGIGQDLLGAGQQAFQQGLGLGQAQQGLGQQLFGQNLQQAQLQAALGQQLFGQGTTAAQQQAALGQQLFGQSIGVGQALTGAGQQAFQQGLGLGQAQQGLAQQLYGQGLGASQQQAALGQQGFAQQLAAAQARQGLGQGLYGMGAGTAQQLAALGAGAQGAALQGGQAQLAAGQAQQQTAQAGLQALYNQFLQQQAYPYQAAQFLANIATGTGALSGSTQTAVTPGGLLSDVRMKENIREVGKTFDGQPVYSYNYKGDDRTQMGLIAQEVEQKHPEAVGLAGGMKTVDYEKATRDSAREPVTIDGEYTASEGGPVSPHRAGEGFARGGYADGGSPGLAAPGDMAAILQAQAQMFGPFSGNAMQTSGLPGAGGYVPQANLPVSELVTPGDMPQGPSAIEQMRAIADIGKTGQEIYQKYKENQEKNSPATSNSASNDPERGAAYGGLIAKADGGAAVLPYQNQSTKLDIPSDPMQPRKLETPGMPQGRSAIEDIKDIAQIAATVMSFSDARVKEDIKHIGNTHDGQKIYSYRYKGEPQTHIGLLAQEVEKKHPDAVGNIDGIKTVDYDAATENAAKRALDVARKAYGGSLSRHGYATDGRVGATGTWEPESFLERAKRELGELPENIQKYWKGDYLKPPPNTPAFAPFTTQKDPSEAIASNKPQDRPFVDPAAKNKAMPSSAFSNLPESPEPGLAGGVSAPQVGTGSITAAPSAPASMTGVADTGMAPTFGGLVGARSGKTPESVAKDPKAPVESRMDAFMKWVKQPQNFIPLATGIAAATAAPTRNTFVALAQGLGAGAQAYQPVMQKQAELAKTKAETGKIGAETGQLQAVTLGELQQIANIRGLIPKEDPNGIYSVGDKRYSLVPVSQAISRTSSTDVLPSGASGTPTTGVLGPKAIAAAQDAGTRFLMASEPEQAASRQQIDQSLAAGNKARNDLIDINRFAQSAALPRTPLLEQGALFPIKSQLANFYDSLVTTFIKDPKLQTELRIDPASMTQAQISEKVAFGTAALRESGAGQRSLGALEAFLSGSPNQTQTRDTMVNLIADMIIHNQKMTDEAAAISEFDKLVEANTGLPRSFYYTDAVQAYQKDKPITSYEKDRDQLVKIMMSNGYQELVNALKNPDVRSAMISSLDKAYGQGFHRYFTGNVMQ